MQYLKAWLKIIIVSYAVYQFIQDFVMNHESTFPSVQEEFTVKFAQLSLSETDDENSRSFHNSPLVDDKLNDLLWKLPPIVRQQFAAFGLLYKQVHSPVTVMESEDSLVLVQLIEGKKEGNGYQIWPKLGNFLEGFWVNDQLEGYCRMFYSNGDIFECEFHSGKTQGFGIFRSSRKIVKGLWVDNQLEGEGQEIRVDGTKYFGHFRNGKKDGRCLVYFRDGTKFEGQMTKNKMHGQGLMLWADGSYFSGEFKNGLISGYGQYVHNAQILQGYFNEVKDGAADKIGNNAWLQKIVVMNSFGQQLLLEKVRLG